MGAVGLLVEGQFRGPVVGQGERAPGERRWKSGLAGLTVHSAGLGQAFARAPIVAQMEFPAEIQEQPLA